MSYTPGPLPEPALEDHEYELWGQNARGDFFTAEQLSAHTAAEVARAVAAERERCAKVCDEISDEYQRRECFKYPELKTDAQEGASECAAAIRSTPQPLQDKGE